VLFILRSADNNHVFLVNIELNFIQKVSLDIIFIHKPVCIKITVLMRTALLYLDSFQVKVLF